MGLVVVTIFFELAWLESAQGQIASKENSKTKEKASQKTLLAGLKSW